MVYQIISIIILNKTFRRLSLRNLLQTTLPVLWGNRSTTPLRQVTSQVSRKDISIDLINYTVYRQLRQSNLLKSNICKIPALLRYDYLLSK